MRIQIEELDGKSAFDLCRHLLLLGHAADELLEVYRGDTLAYTVSSLKWGACQRIIENNKVGPFVGKWRPMSEKDKERLKNLRKISG